VGHIWGLGDLPLNRVLCAAVRTTSKFIILLEVAIFMGPATIGLFLSLYGLLAFIGLRIPHFAAIFLLICVSGFYALYVFLRLTARAMNPRFPPLSRVKTISGYVSGLFTCVLGVLTIWNGGIDPFPMPSAKDFVVGFFLFVSPVVVGTHVLWLNRDLLERT